MIRSLVHLARFRPLLFCLTVLSWIFASCFPLAYGLITRAIFDWLSGAEVSGLSLWVLLGLLLLIKVISVLMEMGWLFLHLTFEFTLEALLRLNLLDWLVRPGEHTLPASPGEAISRFRDDVEDALGPLNEWYRLIGEGIFAILALVIMIHINVSITLIALFPVAFVVALLHQSRTRLRVYREASHVATGHVTGYLADLFSAVLAVKVAGAETPMLERFHTLNERRRKAALKNTLFMSLLDAFQANIGNLGTGVILLLAAEAMRQGSFTVGDLALFVTYLNEALQLPRRIGRLLASHIVAGISHQRLMALLPGDRPQALIAHTPFSLRGALPDLPLPLRTAPDRLDTLEAIGLTYHYPGNRRGIEHISLRIERGQFVVITGRIGAGKTTLVQTLLGQLPRESGEMRWNGQHVPDPATFFVPPRSAYTPQVPQLFSVTLQDNILLGLPERPIDLEAAIRLAALEHDLSSLPAGLQTLPGPRGARLSGGQAQRTAAARMFVRAPELLVFDDLSSALDVETERALWEQLSPGGDITCLAVSHRRAAFEHADWIIVLNKGKVEAEGTLQELLATCLEMQRLWYGMETVPGIGNKSVGP